MFEGTPWTTTPPSELRAVPPASASRLFAGSGSRTRPTSTAPPLARRGLQRKPVAAGPPDAPRYVTVARTRVGSWGSRPRLYRPSAPVVPETCTEPSSLRTVTAAPATGPPESRYAVPVTNIEG